MGTLGAIIILMIICYLLPAVWFYWQWKEAKWKAEIKWGAPKVIHIPRPQGAPAQIHITMDQYIKMKKAGKI